MEGRVRGGVLLTVSLSFRAVLLPVELHEDEVSSRSAHVVYPAAGWHLHRSPCW